jgi:glycerophosphoryl diester phosphodiesterase
MVIAYSYAEAKRYHELNKDIMMEVFMPDSRRVAQFASSGVPWENVVAFVAQARPPDKGVYELIHRKGVLCIVGSHRSHDQEYLSGKNKRIYQELIADGADIIEADRAIEAGVAIRPLAPKDSSKSRFFSTLPGARDASSTRRSR